MERTCMNFLINWVKSSRRLPIVIRGARQVGKTWVVRHLAESQDLRLVEINFEANKEFFSFFSSNDPKIILKELELGLNVEKIDPRKTLLFLDEIQVVPELYAKLRWFAEKMPELAVIATGSLFEFIFDKAKAPFSVPVGRIEFMYLEPFSFEEFLLALNKNNLIRVIHRFTWDGEIPAYTHSELMRFFKEYIIVGGMPAAVKAWVEHESFFDVSKVHQNIIATYKGDFYKYSGRLDPSVLEDTMDYVPLSLGKKFVYSKVSKTGRVESIKKAFNLLGKARVCHKVLSTAANGVPLRGERNEKFIKALFLDVGLCSAALKLSLKGLKDIDELSLVNSGGIAEQVVGQLLRTIEPLFMDLELYYWQRHKKGAEAKIDYVIQHEQNVVPLEVKAGSRGELKSLHYFMGVKKKSLAVRVFSGKPSKLLVRIKDSEGTPLKYELRSLPFYLLSELYRLLD